MDHNIRTLDGKNTFHGMGIIGAFTPVTNVEVRIRRTNVTAADIADLRLRNDLYCVQWGVKLYSLTHAAVRRINIHNYTSNFAGILSSVRYEHLSNRMVAYPHSAMDFLWKISPVLSVDRPLWSGFMQMVHQGDHRQTSSAMFLPMIDLDPNDPTCIYSTLIYICSHARKYNCTSIITFDQPLWWKANMIVESQPGSSELHSVVVRLGGFHAQMSFLGSIGHLMKGSGIEDLLKVIYASNTVAHILSGKAVSRAVRGHFIVDASLHSLLAAKIFGFTLPAETTDLDISMESEDASTTRTHDATNDAKSVNTEPQNHDIQYLCDIMKKILSGEIGPDDIEHDRIVLETIAKMSCEVKNLSSSDTSSHPMVSVHGYG